MRVMLAVVLVLCVGAAGLVPWAGTARAQTLPPRTVEALVEANRAGAPLLGVPGPDAGAGRSMGPEIARQWAAIDLGLRDALTHADQYAKFGPRYVASLPPGLRAQFIKRWQPQILAGGDADGVQFRLAEVMAFTGQYAAKHGVAGGGAAGGLVGAHDRQVAIDRAGRSIMPGCSAPAGQTLTPERRSFCNPMPWP